MQKKTIQTDLIARPVGPYSAGTLFERLIFVSGQAAQVPETGRLISDSFKEQTRQALTNLLNIVKAGGGDISTILEINCFLLSMDDFSTFNAAYANFFADCEAPARTTVAVSALPLNAKVEVKAIAFSKS